MKVVFRCLPELEGLLPRPIPARRGMPQWLKDMPLAAESRDAGTTVKTVKRCPPFLDAMQSGFLMLLPCDIEVRDGSFEWNWQELPSFPRHTPRSPLGFHVADQLIDSPLFTEDTIFIKFQNLWTIETEPGYSLLVTHPVNRLDLPFRSLTGLVDSDRYKDSYIHFPAAWLDPTYSGRLPRGTPVAQCVPVKRDSLDLAFEPLSGEALDRLVETQDGIPTSQGAYKAKFRVKKR